MDSSDFTGLVVEIERFSTQNGPGIRTTVFMKGCPLRCEWCGNPETQSYIPEIMLNTVKCTGCGRCVSVCPNDAIEVMDHKASIRFNRCLNCLKCTRVCENGGIRTVGKQYTSQELYEAVIRDREFYGVRGGVTFTGGEPLSQWEVLLPVLKKLKKDGIGVCMDTTGHVDWTVLEQISEYVTIFLYDVKHLKDQLHRGGTGVGNKLILENLKKLASMGVRIWMRVPVVPGFNDDTVHIRKISILARELDVERLCLLPFHTLGSEKYSQLGRMYPYGDTGAYTAEEINRVREIAEKYFQRVYVS